jgi:hypothetical protein
VDNCGIDGLKTARKACLEVEYMVLGCNKWPEREGRVQNAKMVVVKKKDASCHTVTVPRNKSIREYRWDRWIIIINSVRTDRVILGLPQAKARAGQRGRRAQRRLLRSPSLLVSQVLAHPSFERVAETGGVESR